LGRAGLDGPVSGGFLESNQQFRFSVSTKVFLTPRSGIKLANPKSSMPPADAERLGTLCDVETRLQPEG